MFAADNFFVESVRSGLIECSKMDVSCELSAGVLASDGNGTKRLVVGNDKTPKSGEESAIFTVDIFNNSNILQVEHYYTSPTIRKAQKFEGMTSTPDGRFIIATTAFDRFDVNNTKYDGYNTLIAWQANMPEKVSHTTSNPLKIRELLLGALQAQYGSGIQYFKVEGLTVAPNNKLIFGVRELGESYQTFKYGAILVEAQYVIYRNEFLVDDTVPFRVISGFDDMLKKQPLEQVGLSSMEYDFKNKKMYMLTSVESFSKDTNKTSLGGYLWSAELTDGKLQKITPAKGKNGQIFKFMHKSEGLAILSADELVIIHDDDREKTSVRLPDGTMLQRLPNQAAFEILKILTGKSSLSTDKTKNMVKKKYLKDQDAPAIYNWVNNPNKTSNPILDSFK